MKALVLTAPSTFEYRDVPSLGEPASQEVIVRIEACGICGSDLHGMDGRSGRRIPPIIMGHEASGEIVELGDGVSGWEKGGRVTFDSTVFCGNCDYCQNGKPNLCQNRQVLGVSCQAFRRDGCFAEYVRLPSRILHRLPEGLAYEEAAFAEPVGVALHAVQQSGLKAGQRAVVVGSGLIGLLIIQALRLAGASKIIAVDLDSGRLELAKTLGATDTVLANDEDALGKIRVLAGGDGADCAFEVVGIGSTLKTAIQSLRCGGSVCCVGNLQAEVPLPLQLLVTREIRIIGTCAIANEYPTAVQLIASGEIKVRPLLSAAVPLQSGAEWFARLA